MVDDARLLELLKYSDEAFDIIEAFWVCDAAGNCFADIPDTSEPTLHIAYLFALGEHRLAMEIYDVFMGEKHNVVVPSE